MSTASITVPDHPIIPFIEGDGTGRDIWRASQRVFDAAVQKAYGGKRTIAWFEVFAGEKAFRQTQNWLPDDTVNAARDFRVSIKGPLTTPVGGGIRSLNVALRQVLDLYSVHAPGEVLQRRAQPGEASGEARRRHLPREHRRRLRRHRVPRGHARGARSSSTSSTTDAQGHARRRSAPTPASASSPSPSPAPSAWCAPPSSTRSTTSARSVTLVHKGNIQKFTEGAFREWGYEVATQEFRDQTVTERESWILGNLEANPSLTVEQNAALIEPGLEFGTEDFGKSSIAEVKSRHRHRSASRTATASGSRRC